MQIPVNREMALKACKTMKDFHSELTELYTKNGMNLSANRGRRNVLMSAPMEHFLAKAIKDTGVFPNVSSDGRTGEADITIHNHGGNTTEIECKLTSPHQSSGSIAFQTDHDTLVNKGNLDYVYIIANEDFTGFCVIYFSGLSIEDFRGLSPGARGKVQMYKHFGMKKATVLVGSSISSKDKKLKKLADELKEKVEAKTVELQRWREELSLLGEGSNYRKKILNEQIQRGLNYIDESVNITADNVRITKSTKARYSFKYETV